MHAVEILLFVAAVYAGCGVVFALAFAAAGARRVDPSVPGSSWGFYALILPGSAALWPLLLAKWIAALRCWRQP